MAKSSGEILYLQAEDSKKVNYVTHTSDARTREVVRKVIALMEKNDVRAREHDLLEALLTTQDKDWLIRRATRFEADGKKDLAVNYWLAVRDVKRAVNLMFQGPLRPVVDRYRLSELLTIAHIAGVQDLFEAELFRQVPQAQMIIADLAKDLASKRFTPERKLQRGNCVDSSFSRHLLYLRRGEAVNVDAALRKAQTFQTKEDDLNAGVWFMDAAFSIFLGQEYHEPTENPSLPASKK